jgi:hypothetical protein
MHEEDPSVIADQLVRRDQRGQYDYVQVMLDPNRDRQTGYLFRVSAAGAERDAFLFDDTRQDVDFDAVWASAVHQDSAGWSVEMRIPFSQIRFDPADSAQTWGVNFERRRLASNSVSYFSLESRTIRGVVSQFGHLTGVVAGERRFLELEPFLSPDVVTAPAEPADPFFDGTDAGLDAGVEARLGLGPNFSLDATVNPSFGEVEVDPAVVNLSAFETFFREKRPFFVQDAQIFDFDVEDGRLFFSRRIGRQLGEEENAPEDAAFVDVPNRVTILGASKLTGRTPGGLSVGVLGAVTQGESGRAYLEGSGTVESFPVTATTGWGIGRVRQDFRDGASEIGAVLMGMDRRLPGSGALDGRPSSYYAAGVDFEHNWGGPRRRRWSLSGFFAGTRVGGTPEAMIDIQTNSQHFFQRPDADDLSVDSTSTHMTGATWRLEFARQSAEHLTWSVQVGEVTPDFAANEMGFFTQGEQLEINGDVSYQEITPGPLFRNWRLSLFGFAEFRHELLDDVFDPGRWSGALKRAGVFMNGRGELHNNWSVRLGLDYSPESLSDTETRGGPLMTEPASLGFDVEVETDPREILAVEAEVGYSDTRGDGGHRLATGLGLVFRPTPSWELSLQPQYEHRRDAAQFVDSTGDPGFAPTFGSRYLFADLTRDQVSMVTNLQAAFTPDMSLQLFLQPLISGNDFVTYKQLARPESFDFVSFPEGRAVSTEDGMACIGGRTCVRDGDRFIDFDGDGTTDFTLEERDFNLRSLRAQAVFRWEYHPGSEIFLVWAQDRREAADVGDFDLGRDLDALLGTDARNTFTLKVTHFMSVF